MLQTRHCRRTSRNVYFSLKMRRSCYDAEPSADTPENAVAAGIAALVPSFEHARSVAPAGGVYRGAALLHSMGGRECGGGGGIGQSADGKWSLQQVRRVLEWHLTEKARKQYEEHGDEMKEILGREGMASVVFPKGAAGGAGGEGGGAEGAGGAGSAAGEGREEL